MYGVTVDEILRCERNTDIKNKQLSEDALRAKRKQRFGKFSAKYCILSCLGAFCAVLFALAFVFKLYTSCPVWLFILLIVLTTCGIALCAVTLFYNLYNAKLSEGLVLREDYSEEKKAYALALKIKASKFFLFVAIPLLIFSVVMLIVFFATDPQNYEVLGVLFDVRKSYYITFGVTGGLGILFAATYFIYANVNFLSLANEKQAENHSHNKKLLCKTVGFGAIPFAVFLALMTVFNFVFPVSYSVLLSADTPEDFKRKMQTLTIEDDDVIHTDCGKPAGEYYLNFPESYLTNTVYGLGNGFCGVFQQEYIVTDDRKGFDNKWRWWVYMLKTDELPVANEYGYIDDDLIYDIFFEAYPIESFGVKYVNAAYHFNETYYQRVIGLWIDLTETIKPIERNGKYEYVIEKKLYLYGLFDAAFVIVTGIATATCLSVYIKKRKKQSFDF